MFLYVCCSFHCIILYSISTHLIGPFSSLFTSISLFYILTLLHYSTHYSQFHSLLSMQLFRRSGKDKSPRDSGEEERRKGNGGVFGVSLKKLCGGGGNVPALLLLIVQYDLYLYSLILTLLVTLNLKVFIMKVYLDYLVLPSKCRN